jgi:23S rRNA (cytidine1920-2'-O)/16S rRNA (cytidine1409-2'-O)-methyltransferase
VLYRLLKAGGETVALVKPQFEAGKENVGKNGIVRDPRIHREVVLAISQFAASLGFVLKGLSYSPITGGEGNIEFLLYLHKAAEAGQSIDADWESVVDEVVSAAHQSLH